MRTFGKFYRFFCFGGCIQPWLFFKYLLCCSSFVQKRKGKPTHQLYLSSWNASMLMKRNITSYFSSWFMWSLMQEYSLVFALLLSFVESGHLMQYFWVDCFTSRLCTVSPTYITHYNTTLSSRNLPQGIQYLKTKDVVGKIFTWMVASTSQNKTHFYS